MNIFSHVRRTILGLVVAALLLAGGVFAFVSASTLTPATGHARQAHALRAALHGKGAKGLSPSTYFAAFVRPHGADGRYIARGLRAGRHSSARRFMQVGAPQAPIEIDEAVQTFDLFAPNPFFQAQPDLPLTPTNLTPVWSHDERFIVFSSNLGGDGHFHLYALAATGNTTLRSVTNPTLVQITSGPGNEFFPTLNSNDSVLAFTSDANSAGDQELYEIGNVSDFGGTGVPFQIGGAPVNVQTLAGNPAADKTRASRLDAGGNAMFTNVGRPTLSPDGGNIMFSAITRTGSSNTGVPHIYFLFTGTNGYLSNPPPNAANPPAQLTDGAAADTDPAWSPDGNYIAFASTATTIANTNNTIGVGPGRGPTTATAGNNGIRSIFLLTGNDPNAATGRIPNNDGTAASVGVQVAPITVAGQDNFGPAWSFTTQNEFFNANSSREFLSFARGAAPNTNHDIYYFELTRRVSGGNGQVFVIAPENTRANPVNKLNTDDPTNVYDDVYPTWSPFLNVFSMAYQSPRSVTYNTPGTNVPVETAISLTPGTNGVGAGYVGILQSQVLNLDPPTLRPFSGTQVIGVQDNQGQFTRQIQPSPVGGASPVTFFVRLSNREAGNDDNNIYLQIKDPDSKYQDSRGLEHKVFANLNDADSSRVNLDFTSPLFNPRGALGSGTSIAVLFNAGIRTAAGDNVGTFNINNINFRELGAVAGFDGNNNITVGHTTDPARVGTNVSLYRPWGPEYECQYLNPTVANPGVNVGDYGVPFYLAGVDDQGAFSGSSHPPRPTVDNLTSADPRNRFAQYLKLNRLPDAQQDGRGGVLYSATYTTPNSPSDFFLDVIAYDKAVFPNVLTSPFSGQSQNWRIYDNVGGFSTQTFNASNANDILVVSDYALGQKFTASTFGGRVGSSNLPAIFFGAESYYTDIDENLLPNATDLRRQIPAPPAPATPPQNAGASGPTNLTATATPSNAVTLVFQGNFSDTYTIFRRDPGAATFVQIAQVPPAPNTPPTAPGAIDTRYVDTQVQNGLIYTYQVTGTKGGVTSQPSNAASATPQDFTGASLVIQRLDTGGRFPFPNPFYPNVLNGLGVGSYYDGSIDDGGRQDASGANLPVNNGGVPFVKSQKYSLYRILSRGPVTAGFLAGFKSTITTQPTFVDPSNNFDGGVPPSKAASVAVPVAQKCVIWVSPYTGILSRDTVDQGTLQNLTTQDTLKAFVNSGGRLCLTGQNVAGALSSQGAIQNNDFLTNTLNAKFDSTGNGSQQLSAGANRIAGDSSFNGGIGFYPLLNGAGNFDNVPPFSAPLLLGNDFGAAATARSDGSLDQLGPASLTGFFGSNTVRAQINTITALNGATTGINTGGNLGLIYKENYPTAADGLTPAVGFGSRVVFGSFGLEGIGIEYRKVTINSVDYYVPNNQRPNILHNVVSYLRTAVFNGRITQGVNQGVDGATVYLRPNGGTLPGLRQAFSATTAGGGFYSISGVEPGSYSVVVFKSGFTRVVSTIAFGVQGDNSATVNLTITRIPPGRIAGTVTDATGAPVQGASVSFISVDGQVTVGPAVTNALGKYSIDNVDVNSYNGTATKGNQFIAGAPTQGNPIAVPSNQTAPADFVLQPKPAAVSGTVFNDGNVNGARDGTPLEPGINGAKVTFTPQSGPAVTTTADANGAYSVNTLLPGTYTVTASATDFQQKTPITVTVISGDVKTQDVPLVFTPAGALQGTVKDLTTGQPVAGVTVTFTPTAGGGAVTAQTDAQGNYGPIPAPPGAFNGVASKNPPFNDAAPDGGNPITVNSAATTTVNFSLTGQLATVKGTTYYDPNDNAIRDTGETPLPGVTVVFTPTQFGANATALSDPNGQYTAKLVEGTYTVTATKVGFRDLHPFTITVGPAQTKTGVDVPLIVPPGTLGGQVTDAFSGLLLGGATITIRDAANNVVTPLPGSGSLTTGGTATAGPDGQPINFGPVRLLPGTYSVTVNPPSGYFQTSQTGIIVVSDRFTRVDFTMQKGVQPLHVFPAGLNFFSVPYNYASVGVTPDLLFGPLNTGTFLTNPPVYNPPNANRSHLFVYRPELLQYVVDPTPPADSLRLGQGYWVFLRNGREVNFPAPTPGATVIPVGLRRGWNMIGVPSALAVNLSRLTFANPAGTGPITFDQAASNTFRIVSPTLYGYTGNAGNPYYAVTSGAALQPWQAYWIYAYVDSTIQIPTTGG